MEPHSVCRLCTLFSACHWHFDLPAATKTMTYRIGHCLVNVDQDTKVPNTTFITPFIINALAVALASGVVKRDPFADDGNSALRGRQPVQGSTTGFGRRAIVVFPPEVLAQKTSSAMSRSLCAIIFRCLVASVISSLESSYSPNSTTLFL